MEVNFLIASRIKNMRNSLGLTSESVAHDLKISKSTYSLIENGKVEISVSRLSAIAKLFKVPMETFINGKDGKQTINISYGEHATTQINNYSNEEIDQLILQCLNRLQDHIQPK